jgi:uncharacterized membrane protein YccC
MTGASKPTDRDGWLQRSATAAKTVKRAAGPPLLFGLRVWASVCLALYVAFWLELDNPFWAGTSAAIVCQPQLGASLRKGWYRMVGTCVGAVMSVVLTACFPQDRILFLGGVALWGAACAFVASVLRNFGSYSAALAGYTVAIISGDLLGAAGGVTADAAFLIAVTRATEICIGIVCAGIVLALTDRGDARRRLATLFAGLAAGIMAHFIRTLAIAGADFTDTQPMRRDLLRQTIALDPIIDQALGESSQIRYYSPILQQAVDGMFAALDAWRTIANHLATRPSNEAQAESAAILQTLPPELRSAKHLEPARWTADPIGLLRICEEAGRRLVDLSVGTPSMRLLANNTAQVLTGMAQALNGLALLVADPARPDTRRFGVSRLRVPDMLPALINAGRAFVVIDAVALFWIVTAWPNGAGAITWTAITVILFSPRADQAYAVALRFTIGTAIVVVFAAIWAFAVLPQLVTFAGFSLAIGAYMIPAGALMAQQWQSAVFVPMVANFIPLLGPTNPMTYDTVQFYNSTMSVVVGTCVGVLSFRLLPPLSPAFRTRRLLALTLRDLRRLAAPHRRGHWRGTIRSQLSAVPDEATPLQRAQVLAALAAGSEIIALRDIGRRLGLSAALDPALAGIARGDSASAISHLADLDQALARTDAGPLTQTVLRARGRILALSEVLKQYAQYFNGGSFR